MNNKNTTILNCKVDLCSKEFAIEEVKKAIENKNNFQIITINPEMIMNAQKNKPFFKIVNNSDLNIIDGIGVKIALKIKGINQENIRGIDFSRQLIQLADENNYKIGFLGAKEDIINKAVDNIKEQYPNLNIVYKRNGYFKELSEIESEIINSAPQIMLVGLGSPRQEEIIVELKNKIQGCVFIGVGGSFDVYSGVVEESPEICRKLGIEWLYRTIKQPERFKRIFPTLPLFLIKCIINTILNRG